MVKKIIIRRRALFKRCIINLSSLFSLSSLSFFSQNAFAMIGKFYGFRTWESPDKTRIVADFSTPVEYKSFVLKNPLRVVFDISNARPIKTTKPDLNNDPRITEIRSGMFNNRFRIVLELKKNSQIKSFVLKPQGKFPYRLVVDVIDFDSQKEPLKSKTNQNQNDNELIQSLNHKKVYTVLIDPGHGGEDPGAVGRSYKTYEKNVVLDISKSLANQINRHPKMKAYLTRSSDYYISLRERINKAKKYDADLFISIHADSAPNRKAKGSSVYILSTKGASGEFERILAKRENAADFIGGVESANQDLSTLLLSVVQNDTIDKSNQLAKSIINQLAKLRKPHFQGVKQAGFVVLKSPHIPSVLVETAFLSNRTDESFLKDKNNRSKIASLIYQGVKDYLNV